MPQLSEHFSLEELTVTNTKIRNQPSEKELDRLRRTARQMEAVRALLGRSIQVSSGYRCPAVNKAVGGSPSSDHMNGDAVDFVCPDFGSPLKVALAIQTSAIKYDQLIQEGSWVHISFGPRMRQQDLTKRPGGKYDAGIHP